MINIIIPVFLFDSRILDITKRCFQSIKDTTHSPCRIVWIDNGSDAKLFDHLKDYIFRHNIHCDIIRNDSNLGYTKAINQGIQYSLSNPQSLIPNSYLVLANNDIIAAPGWDQVLIKILEEHSEIGCITPLTDSKCSIPQQKSDYWFRFLSKPLYIIAPNMVAFYFALFKTQTIQQLGLLDERLENGWDTDKIYCKKIWESGLQPAICPQITFHHEHSVTFRHIYGNNLIPHRQQARKHRKSLYQ